jgi:hypothetical protein
MIALLRIATTLPCVSVMPALLLPIEALTTPDAARNMQDSSTTSSIIAALETPHAQ